MGRGDTPWDPSPMRFLESWVPDRPLRDGVHAVQEGRTKCTYECERKQNEPSSATIRLPRLLQLMSQALVTKVMQPLMLLWMQPMHHLGLM